LLALPWGQSSEGIPLAPADASLRSVQFVDGDEGWCVGEEGLILHSIDSGKTWEKQPSGTHGTLESVHFQNPYEGWVVGHDDRFPFDSNGIVLFTRDGGVTWKRILMGEVPALYGVRFHEKQGWLVGVANLRFPGGFLLTRDGGVKWEPGPSLSTRGWLGVTSENGQPIIHGPKGKVACQEGDRWLVRELDPSGSRPIRSIWGTPGQAIAAGEGGLFLRERDGRWEPITGALSNAAQPQMEFRAVNGIGKLRFAVGAPGNVLLRSLDEGSRWEKIQVPGLAGINSIQFADQKKGWMVGDRGAIWLTQDSGATWTLVRQGGSKTSHLILTPNWSRLPTGIMVQLGWIEGVHCELYAVGGHPQGESGRFRSGEMVGMRALGVTATREGFGSFTQSPPQVATKVAVFEQLEKVLGPEPREALLRRLVLALRSSRPDDLVLNFSGADQLYQGWEAIIEELIPRAVIAARDPGQFPEQIEELGLAPWKVRRLFVPSPVPTGHVRIDLMTVRPRIKAGVKDYTSEYDFQKASFANESGESHFKGSYFFPGEEKEATKRMVLLDCPEPKGWSLIQRKLEDPGDLSSDELRALRKKSQVMELVGAPDSELATTDTLASNLDTMLKGVDDMQAARVLSALARQSVSRGKWNLARELYLQFLNRYPTHPGATEAARWVILHNASGEARRRHELRQVLVEGVIDFQTSSVKREDSSGGFASLYSPPSRSKRPVNPAEAQNPGIALARAIQEGTIPMASPIPNLPQTTNRVTTQLSFVENVLEAKKWYEEALQSGKRLESFGSLVAGDPRIQLSLASAARKLGDFRPTQEYCEEIAKGTGGGDPSIDSWRKAAAMELWLSHRKGDAPKPIWTCRKTEGRPYLDGDLDDPFWAGLTPIKFHSPTEDSKSKAERNEPLAKGPMVLFAHDEQFLYVGIRVQSSRPVAGAQNRQTKRGHDTGLSQLENLTLLIDADRDYSTSYLFRLDPRGWIDDQCWGDQGWNPRWFLATRKKDGFWEAEMAIPLALLVTEKVSHGKSWAVNVFHHDPENGGTYALNRSRRPPGEDLDPYDFGILYFQNPQAIPTKRNGEEVRDPRSESPTGSRQPSKPRPGVFQPISKPGQGEPSIPPGTNSDR